MAFSFVHGARIFGFAKIPVNGNKFFQLQENVAKRLSASWFRENVREGKISDATSGMTYI